MPAISPTIAPCLSRELLLLVQIGYTTELVFSLYPTSTHLCGSAVLSVSLILRAGPSHLLKPHPEPAWCPPHPSTTLSLGRKPGSQAVQKPQLLLVDLQGEQSGMQVSLQKILVPPDVDTARACFLLATCLCRLRASQWVT